MRDMSKKTHGAKRVYVGGRVMIVRHRTHPGVKTLLYRDNTTNLTGPIVGGSSKNVMHRLTKAMAAFAGTGVKHHRRHHHRVVRGGCLNMI